MLSPEYLQTKQSGERERVQQEQLALATLPSELLKQRQQSFRKQYLQSFIYVSISGVIFLFVLNQYFFEIKFDNN